MMRFGLLLILAGAACAQNPPAAPEATKPAPAEPAKLVLEDQFGRPQDLASLKGDVVVLVYGDRHATEACRALGEKLHVTFHPSAAGQAAEKARTAPVIALPGVAADARSPDVFVVPVATASVPTVVRELIRRQIRKAAPDTPVWLDFEGKMEKEFGQRAGQPNLVVIDGQARLRLKVAGDPDEEALTKMLQTVQNLRAEAAGLVPAK